MKSLSEITDIPSRCHHPEECVSKLRFDILDQPYRVCDRCNAEFNGRDELQRLEDEQQERQPSADALDECYWPCDEDGVYTTQCGNPFEFISDGLEENSYFKYCPYCGKRITTIRQHKGGKQG